MVDGWIQVGCVGLHAISLLLGSSGGVRPAVVGRQDGTSAGAFNLLTIFGQWLRINVDHGNHMVSYACDLS